MCWDIRIEQEWKTALDAKEKNVPMHFLLFFLAMSPDNSFLGFAVGSHVEKRPFLKKKKRIVIYGDEASISKVNHAYIVWYFLAS